MPSREAERCERSAAWAAAAAGGALLALLVAGAYWPQPAAEAPPEHSRVLLDEPTSRLRVGAFSGAREVVGTRVLPAFTRRQLRRGHRVVVEPWFTGSETLVDAVDEAFPADVVLFSHTHDVDVLVERGLVAPDWSQRPHGGIVCRSLVVLAVRDGNPRNVRDWADLARPGIVVVTPDPAQSGGGLWNVCALYGAALRGHAGVPAGDVEAAAGFVARVLANASCRHASASDAYAAFRGGAGDVAITYESEIALGWIFGSEAERVLPSSSVLVESPAAVVCAHADAHGVRAIAEALCDHLWTPAAQWHFARCGLRPVQPEVWAANRQRFPDPEDLWTIEFLGGWEKARAEVLALVGGQRDATPPAGAATPGR